MVEIFGSGSAPQRTVQFSATQLAAFPDQEGGDYEVQPGPGGGQVPPGVPIEELLTQAGAAPGAANYAYIIGSTPYRSPLSGATDDFDPTADEFVNQLRPLFYPIGGTTSAPDTYGYVRPLRRNDPDDANNRDYLEVAHGGAITVQVHQSGALLRPTITAVGNDPVLVGQSVRLSATVSDPVEQETLDWTWNLATGGKDLDTGETPALTTPKLTTPGTYYVQAAVTGSSGSSGESNTVVITVRSRKKAPPAATTTGPGRGAGASTNPVGGPNTGSRGRYNGRPGASPTATDAASSTGLSSTSAASTVPSSATDVATPKPSSRGISPLARPSGGQLVAGFALVDPAGAAAANQPVRVAPAAAAAARAGGQHVRASLAWLGVACILALLLAGAGLERRRSFPGPKRRHT